MNILAKTNGFSLNFKKVVDDELTKLIRFMFQINGFIIEIPVLKEEQQIQENNQKSLAFDKSFFKLKVNQSKQKLTFGVFNDTNDLKDIIYWNLNQEVFIK